MGNIVFDNIFPPDKAGDDYAAEIDRLERALFEHPLGATGAEVNDDVVTHYFCNGVYLRRMTLPEGSVVVGKRHRFACLNIIQAGSFWVAGQAGRQYRTAGDVFESPAGTKRALFAVGPGPSIWITAHACPPGAENCVELIEDFLTIHVGQLEVKP